MHLRTTILPTLLLLGTTLAYAATTTPPPPTDVTKLATAFATKLGLLTPVFCREAPDYGDWVVCHSPVNPGINTATSFLCTVTGTAPGCVLPPGVPPTVAPESPVTTSTSTTTK